MFAVIFRSQVADAFYANGVSSFQQTCLQPGPRNGIVWALAPVDQDANKDVVTGIARAYDATHLDPTPIDPQTPRLKLLWDSTRAGVVFNHAKFNAPVVADGRLFVPTYDGHVDMYMLNP